LFLQYPVDYISHPYSPWEGNPQQDEYKTATITGAILAVVTLHMKSLPKTVECCPNESETSILSFLSLPQGASRNSVSVFDYLTTHASTLRLQGALFLRRSK
jgi:hypothetical protein